MPGLPPRGKAAATLQMNDDRLYGAAIVEALDGDVTFSIPETDQVTGGLDSNSKGVKLHDDGSATVYFGPKAPEGQEGNWVQTMPGKGYNAILRLYGPLEPWFEKSWMPGDFEPVK